MLRSWRIVVVVLCVLSVSAQAQEKSYDKVLRNPIVGKQVYQYFPHDMVDTYRTFLGTVTDSRGRVRYYVVKERKLVQAAIVKHGHLNVLLFDRSKRLAYGYLDCDAVPKRLTHNVLHYSYRDYEGKLVVENDTLSRELPEVLVGGFRTQWSKGKWAEPVH